MNGRSCTFQSLVMAGTSHYHGVQIVGAIDHRRVFSLHLVNLCLTSRTTNQ